MTNRRDFLKSASLMTLGALAACSTKPAGVAGADGEAVLGDPATKNLGLQAYSLGGELFSDPANALKKVSEFGYRQLELAFYGNGKVGMGDNATPAADFKKMCDDAGLKICSSHLTPNNLERGVKYGKDNKEKILDYWKGIIDDHKMFGCDYIVQPSLPTINNLEDAQAVADVFNSVGELLRNNGIKFGYHNHSNEFNMVVPGGEDVIHYYERRFKKEEGVEPQHIEKVFIDNTDPQNVLFELDCFWCTMGQQDAVQWINQYKDRIKLLHIKDFSVIGASGAMNFENIFNAFHANGYKDFFVEIEDIMSGHQLERAEASAKYLLSKSFV